MPDSEIISIVTQVVLPIVLGAIIGFVTNAIAIKMLFRPLTKKYIGKIPIPLTPGIIPRQRESLAHSIADMVSNELFSEEVVQNHINSHSFRLDLRKKLMDLTKPSEENEKNLIKNLVNIIQAKSFNSFLSSLGDVILKAVFNLRLGDLIPKESELASGMALISRHIILGSPGKKIESILINWLEEIKSTQVPLEKIVFSKALQKSLLRIFESAYPTIRKILLEWLRTPVMRKELSERGRIVLRTILNKLNPLQRIVVSAGQYDRTLDENMGSIIADILNSIDSFLSSPRTITELNSKLESMLENLGDSGIADLDQQFNIDIVSELTLSIRRLKTAMVKKENHRRIFQRIDSQIQDQSEQKLGDLFHQLTGEETDKLKTTLIEKFNRWAEDEQAVISTLESAQGKIASFFDQRNEGGGEENNQQDDSGRNQIVLGIENILIDVMNSVVPKLVAEFDIYNLVVERINSLEMIKVEELLLGIIARHLRYINIFGAILGGIIGASQVMVRFLS